MAEEWCTCFPRLHLSLSWPCSDSFDTSKSDTGPLGRAFGDTGGDLGFEMAAVAAGIVYPPLRYLELRYFKR